MLARSAGSPPTPTPPRRQHGPGGRRPRQPRWLGLVVLGIVIITLLPPHLILPKVPVGGTVRDGVSSAPIAGARVSLGATTVTTDPDGHFSFDRVSLTESLRVDADGYQDARVAVWPTSRRTVDLTPRSFSLTVRDTETGARIHDALATVDGARATPVEPGRFTVEPARPGIQANVSAPGYRSSAVRYRGNDPLEAGLEPRITGTVVDAATGQPVAGAFLAHGTSGVTSDEHGAFELPRRPTGPVWVLAPGYRRAELDATHERALVARLEPMTARAVYLTYYGVGDRGLRQNVLSLPERTEVNAVIIDVKGDRGLLTYRSAVPLAQQIGANEGPTVTNIDELLATLKQRGIYTIARISVFKDDVLAKNGQRAGLDVAVLERLSGRPWTDGEGLAWVDPFRPEVWEYNIALASEAAGKGFDEVQFASVRFPVEPGGALSMSQARYSRDWTTDDERVETIGGFVRRASDEVRRAGAFSSVDVLAYSAMSEGDQGIGQDFDVLASAVDYLSPTLYPSLFRNGLPGLIAFPQVVQRPYEVVYEGVRRARLRADAHGAILRPWLQYFDDYAWQTGRPYRAAEIDAQRKGVAAAGGGGWMMWDPSNRYARGGLGARP